MEVAYWARSSEGMAGSCQVGEAVEIRWGGCSTKLGCLGTGMLEHLVPLSPEIAAAESIVREPAATIRLHLPRKPFEVSELRSVRLSCLLKQVGATVLRETWHKSEAKQEATDMSLRIRRGDRVVSYTPHTLAVVIS